MADVKKTIAELLTTFGDGQNANDISEQDLRNLIVSMVPSKGVVTMENNVTVTLTAIADQFYTVLGVFVSALGVDITIDAVGGKMTFNGDSPRQFNLNADIVYEATNNDQTFVIQWHLNDAPIGVPLGEKFKESSRDRRTNCYASTLLIKNDVVELKIKNKFNNKSVIVKEAIYNIISSL